MDIVDAELVPLAGDDGAYACRKLSFTHDGVSAIVELVNGVPAVTELALAAPEGLAAADLRAIPLGRLARDVYAHAGTWHGTSDGGWVQAIGPATTARDQQRVADAAATRRRRGVDVESLDQLRQLYAETSGPKGQRVKQIAAVLYKNERQVRRYLKQAGVRPGATFAGGAGHWGGPRAGHLLYASWVCNTLFYDKRRHTLG